jgi:uncharacterized protein (TIGR02996 family)
VISPDLDGLLRACQDAPADDAPRLVLADWLEERGGPNDDVLAELIRVQCRRARLKEETPEHKALVSREQELLGGHRGALLGPLGAYGHLWRGLLDVLIRYTPFFSREVTEALQGGPGIWLDTLVVYGVPPTHAARLAARRCLSRLRVLSVSGTWDDGALKALLTSPHLTHLRKLTLGVRGITADGARALAGWPGLARLQHLDLTGNPIGDDGLTALAAAPGAAGLRVLQLANVKTGPAGMRALAESPHLAGLRELDLGVNFLGDEAATHLAGSPHLGGLQRLLVRNTAMSEAGLQALRERFGDALCAV